MNQYGFVIYPDKGNNQLVIPGLVMDHGISNGFLPDPDDAAAGNSCPVMAFYRREDIRDAEMDAMARKYPGIMLCPITLTRAIKYPAASKPTMFSISDKGFLPE